MSFVLVALGIVLLYVGGEILVKESCRLALSLNISSLVIGLTIVAFGTSTPELVSTLIAAFREVPEIAWGNVVGSNIANLGLILGLSALIYPLHTHLRFIQREVVFMIGAGILLLPLAADAFLSRWEGGLLVSLLVAYLVFLLRSNDETAVLGDEVDLEALNTQVPRWRSGLGLALGIGLLLAGAHVLVEGAVTLAQGLGIPERVIALSLVAVGTSLPELASSVVAAFKGEEDLILGNLVGSNIFNILGILGITAIVHPISLDPRMIQLDLGIMIGISLLVLPFLMTGLRLGRREGTVLLGLYIAYIVFIYKSN